MQGHQMTKENQRTGEAQEFNRQYIALIKG
jgi:hypothetical protein